MSCPCLVVRKFRFPQSQLAGPIEQHSNNLPSAAAIGHNCGTVDMKIVGLLSKATLGHLANNIPLPILASSRLKTLQRFLNSPRFCQEKIWWGI
jgi:hypothetical protein